MQEHGNQQSQVIQAVAFDVVTSQRQTQSQSKMAAP